MADFSTVACAEVHGTVRENRTLDDWTASVDLRCAWADRHLLADDILRNQRPWPYWPFVGGLGLYPRTVGTMPEETEYTQDGQGMNYTQAIASVTYGLPGKAGQPDPTTLVSETLEPTAEFLTLDYTQYKWKTPSPDPDDSDDLKEGESPGILKRGFKLTRMLYNLTSINANILTLPGSVNSTQYVSALLGLTFPAETLLFVPPRLSRTITTDGVGAWNVQLSYEYKENGWNKFWRQSTETYDTIVRQAGGADASPYPLKNQAPWLA